MHLEYTFGFACALLITSVSGRGTWNTSGNYEYYVSAVEVIEPYDDSLAFCESQNGTLALVKTESIQNFLKTLVTDEGATGYPYRFFIGLRDTHSNGIFYWTDGDTLDFSFWKTGEPNNKGEEVCVTIGSSVSTYEPELEWINIKCDAGPSGAKGFVCQRKIGLSWGEWEAWGECECPGVRVRNRTCADSGRPGPDQCTNQASESGHCTAPDFCNITTPMTTTTARPLGRGNWFPNGSFEYYVSVKGIGRSYEESQKFCGDNDGELALVRSKETQSFIASLVSDGSGIPYAFYIGLRYNPSKEKFFWTDGSSLSYASWELNEHEPSDSDDHCVTVGHQYTYYRGLPWHTLPCEQGVTGKKGLACQRPIGKYWSSWTSFTECDCFFANQTRNRTCVDSTRPGPNDCSGSSNESRECEFDPACYTTTAIEDVTATEVITMETESTKMTPRSAESTTRAGIESSPTTLTTVTIREDDVTTDEESTKIVTREKTDFTSKTTKATTVSESKAIKVKEITTVLEETNGMATNEPRTSTEPERQLTVVTSTTGKDDISEEVTSAGNDVTTSKKQSTTIAATVTEEETAVVKETTVNIPAATIPRIASETKSSSSVETDTVQITTSSTTFETQTPEITTSPQVDEVTTTQMDTSTTGPSVTQDVTSPMGEVSSVRTEVISDTTKSSTDGSAVTWPTTITSEPTGTEAYSASFGVSETSPSKVIDTSATTPGSVTSKTTAAVGRSPTPSPQSFNTGAVVGSIAGVFVLIIILVLGVLITRHRRRTGKAHVTNAHEMKEKYPFTGLMDNDLVMDDELFGVKEGDTAGQSNPLYSFYTDIEAHNDSGTNPGTSGGVEHIEKNDVTYAVVNKSFALSEEGEEDTRVENKGESSSKNNADDDTIVSHIEKNDVTYAVINKRGTSSRDRADQDKAVHHIEKNDVTYAEVHKGSDQSPDSASSPDVTYAIVNKSNTPKNRADPSDAAQHSEKNDVTYAVINKTFKPSLDSVSSEEE